MVIVLREECALNNKERSDMTMLIFILALGITVAAMAYGLNISSKFRVAPDETIPKKTRLFIQRKSGFIGIGILPVPLLLYFGQFKIALFFLLIGVIGVLIFVPVILKNKLPLGSWLLACAVIGIGELTRSLLKATIIGWPAVDRVDFVNRHGIEAYLQMCYEQAKRDAGKPKEPGLFEVLFWGDSKKVGDGIAAMTIKNEFGVQDVRSVLVMNGQYFNTDDGEWYDIPK